MTPYFPAAVLALGLFQSALPLRGVTAAASKRSFASRFQSALPLRGVTRDGGMVLGTPKFQSALPLRGVTGIGGDFRVEVAISIRTPLAGSDPP